MSIDKLILSGGLLAVGATVFAESGLLIGILLPGDTLLLGAGILAAQDVLPILPLTLIVMAGAVLGDNVGYSIGRRSGPRIFRKQDGIFFRQEHIEKAEKFYLVHGGKTIIMARFIPIIRTFAPLVAGVGKMPRRRFMFFNIIGGVSWGGGVTLLGYWFGSRIPGLENYIGPTIIGVSVLTFGSILYHALREETTRRRLFDRIKLLLRNFSLNKKID
jgi:membrane-associated protein